MTTEGTEGSQHENVENDGGSDSGGAPSRGGSETPTPGEQKSSEGTISASEFEALKNRMAAADRRATAAEAKVQEYENKDKTELQLAQDEAAKAAKAQEDLERELRAARIGNAFLISNKYAWHNPDRALSLLDLADVTIDDDGKVVGLDKAIDALAKAEPYLIKPSESDDDDDDDEPKVQSGAAVGSAKGGAKSKHDRAAMEAKYPGLRK